MGSPSLLAVIALLVVHGKFNLESLLHEGVCVDFLLHGQFDFDPPGVRLRPDEVSIDELDSLESFDVFEAESEQFCTLQLTLSPWWSLVSVALTTMVQDQVL